MRIDTLPRLAWIVLCGSVATTTESAGTFPIGPIDCAVFDVDDENFAGHDFAFAGETIASGEASSGFSDVTTGLEGFRASPNQIAPIPGFRSGDDVPVFDQALSEFLANFPAGNVRNAENRASIQGDGDFVDGFTSFSMHQRQEAEVDQSTDDFVALATIAKSYATFELASAEQAVTAQLSVLLDASFAYAGAGFIDHLLGASLLDVTDPGDPVPVADVFGEYLFADGDGFVELVENGVDDVSGLLNVFPTGTDPDSPFVSVLSYATSVLLEPGRVYGLGQFSEVGAGSDGVGSARLDSTSTFTASILLTNPGTARLTIPVAIPEPSTALIAAVAGSALPRRRRAG